MWNNLGRLEIELLWLELLSLPLQIEWGTYTMTEFAGLYDMDNRTMRILNRVRLSMEIYAMSDLTTGNGLSIHKDMVAACILGTKEHSQYEWPQEQLTVAERRLWAKKL